MQVNHTFGKGCFLPYSVGLLQAYALTKQEIRDNYEFCGFVYTRESIPEVVKRLEGIDVLGASCYIWNNRYTLALAKAIKEAYPNCLIVLGGPHVPDRSEGYFEKYPFANLLVHNEGEFPFAEILLERLKSNPDYKGIKGLSVQVENRKTFKTTGGERVKNLDEIPSPYLTGVFDRLMEESKYEYHPTQEVDRGCVFKCHFCQWGSSVFTKTRRFPEERNVKELEWFADKRIDLVYNASANYGMTENDVRLTERMVELKKKTGYPRKFRAAYAKNSGERIYRISKMLNDAGMSKGTTLSFQSMDDHTLETIERKNIGTQMYRDLMKRYRKESIPTYSEIIVGLPGETYNSFADGLSQLIDLGAHDSLSVYICEILANAEMGEPEYRQKHGIKSVEVPVLFYHANPDEKQDEETREWYELVVSTSTLPPIDWLKCNMISWIVQSMHCLGALQAIAVFCRHYKGISYREFYEKLITFAESRPNSVLGRVLSEIEAQFIGIRSGKEWGIVDRRFGNIVWPLEEGGFLKIIVDKNRFYDEITLFVRKFIENKDLVKDLVAYQKKIIKEPYEYVPSIMFSINYDLHSYLESAYEGEKCELEEGKFFYQVLRENVYEGNLEEFAREEVWYDRKANSGMCHKVEKMVGCTINED